MTRRTAPAAAAAKPGYPLAEFRPAADNGPRWGAAPCAPTCLPARSRPTLLPRSPTAPPCTVRIGFPAARLWPGCAVPGVRRPAGRFTAHG